jgi:hypothetical protein
VEFPESCLLGRHLESRDEAIDARSRVCLVDRVLFNVGPNNVRSQTAVQRIGGSLVGRVADAERGDRVVFEITRTMWSDRDR